MCEVPLPLTLVDLVADDARATVRAWFDSNPCTYQVNYVLWQAKYLVTLSCQATLDKTSSLKEKLNTAVVKLTFSSRALGSPQGCIRPDDTHTRNYFWSQYFPCRHGVIHLMVWSLKHSWWYTANNFNVIATRDPALSCPSRSALLCWKLCKSNMNHSA